MSARASEADDVDSAAVFGEADALMDAGRPFDALDLLQGAGGDEPDPEVEKRLAVLRYQAFDHLEPASTYDRWPVPVAPATDPGPARLPQLAPDELSGEAVRQAIATHGSVHVPGLFDAATVQRFVDSIEHVLTLRDGNRDTPFKQHSSWFSSLPLPQAEAMSLARPWGAGDGGILACDSPRILRMLLATYERLGLRRVVADYLGERPVLSANKCTLRRARLDGKTDWHQDGAFLGSGIRAVNVWVTLTDCGVDAPGMDIVPKRFHEVQETGTGGAIFDWAVGPDTVEELSVDAPVVRPQYRAGDAMIFDDMLLHRTALDRSMTRTRHAIESWFFAKTDYPEGQVPLVW